MFDRRRLLLGVLPLAVVLGAVGAAWACTYTPRITTVTPQAGPRGTEVVMEGQGVADTRLVEIRWNALDGPVLTRSETDQGNFKAAIRVPDVPPGVYTLVAATDGGAVARGTLEVLAEGPAAQPAVRNSGGLGRNTEPLRSSPSPGGFPAGAALLAAGAVSLFASAGLLVVRKKRIIVAD